MKIELTTGMHKRDIEAIAAYLREHPKEMKKMVAIALTNDMTPSMKASWIISTASVQQKGCLNAYVDEIILALPNISTSGTRRELLKALLHNDISKSDHLGALVDTVFTFMRRTTDDLAVSYNSVKVMQKMIKQYPELKSEFDAILHDQMEYGSETWRKLAKHVMKKTGMRKKE